MMGLYLPKTNKHPGINIYCPKCNKWINYKNHKTCEHPDSRVYRIAIRNPNNGQLRSKILKTKDYETAIKEAVEFKQNLRNNIPIQKIAEEDLPCNIVEAIAMYNDYLNNVGVPEHKKVYRSTEYIKHQKMFIEKFLVFLKRKVGSLCYFNITDLNDSIIGDYYKHLKDQKFSPSSFNHFLKAVSTFYNYLIKVKRYKISNPFYGIAYRKHTPVVCTINENELRKLLSVINEKNGEVRFPSCTKNYYFPWLESAILLGLYTGRREEELINFRFSDIETDENGKPVILVCNDIKASRLKRRIDEDELSKKLVFVPIIRQLHDLLMKLGYDQYKNTDRVLLAPEITDRKELHNRMSRSFTHFWNKAGFGYRKTFYALRRTYITEIERVTNGNARSITGHSCDSIVQKHYVDSKVISKRVAESDFKIF